MKTLVCLLMLATAWRCDAADFKDGAFPVVLLSPFPDQIGLLKVSAIPGKPTERSLHNQAFKGGFPNEDYPPHTQIEFTDQRNRWRKHYLDVFRITQVQEAPYVSIQPCIEQLKKLLDEHHPDQLDKLDIPVFPFRNAARTIQSKTRYFHAAWGNGILYITSFASGNGDYPANETFEYLFQGLTEDGKFYVSGDFSISNPRFARRDYVRLLSMDKWDDLLARADELLTKLPDHSFSPALDDMQSWLSSLDIK